MTTLHSISTGVAASAVRDCGSGVEPRAMTFTSPVSRRIVVRIALSSADADSVRHPRIRSTVHADAVRPHPWLFDPATRARR